MKLPDYRLLGEKILKKAVDNANKVIETALIEDPIDITLTFNRWTNIKNKQLLEAVLITSERRPYIWKVVDISSKREIMLRWWKK